MSEQQQQLAVWRQKFVIINPNKNESDKIQFVFNPDIKTQLESVLHVLSVQVRYNKPKIHVVLMNKSEICQSINDVCYQSSIEECISIVGKKEYLKFETPYISSFSFDVKTSFIKV